MIMNNENKKFSRIKKRRNERKIKMEDIMKLLFQKKLKQRKKGRKTLNKLKKSNN